jgi:hypothetical protein
LWGVGWVVAWSRPRGAPHRGLGCDGRDARAYGTDEASAPFSLRFFRGEAGDSVRACGCAARGRDDGVRRVSRGGDDGVRRVSRGGDDGVRRVSRGARSVCRIQRTGTASRSAGLSPNSRGRPSSGQLVATQPRGGTTWRPSTAAGFSVALFRDASRVPSRRLPSRRFMREPCSLRLHFRIVFGPHETMNCARFDAYSRGAYGQDYREARVR